jgi:hypothetical protein
VGKPEVVISRWTILVKGPTITGDETPDEWDSRNQEVYDDFLKTTALQNARDVINDALPDGYECEITD